jgi:signal transduction histidine kinase/HAMP domain-containing protein
VQRDKEQKVFQSVLWIFLLGSLVFFVARLSAGKIYLPAPIWYMFLLLDVGFIVFIFVPHAGQGLAGTPGRHEETIEDHRWYPQDLGEIIEKRPDAKAVKREGVRPPFRPVPPVPLVPLVLLLASIVAAYRGGPSEQDWEAKEAARLRIVYGKAQNELARLEGLAVGLAERTAKSIDWRAAERMPGTDRAALIQRLDSLAKSLDLGEGPFSEVGLQVFSPEGERIAWGGSPRYLEEAWPGAGGRIRVFTGKTPLYTLLVCEVLSPGSGRIVVDIPLEVNYRIKNPFLRSTSLGKTLSRRYGNEIEFSFPTGEHRGPAGWNDLGLARREVRVLSSPDVGVQVVGVVQASTGLPLAWLKVLGRPYATAVREGEARRALWAGFFLSVASVIIAVWVFRTYVKRRGAGGSRRLILARRIVVLAAFIIIIRLLFVELNIPGALIGTALFDTDFFADIVPGGLMRNAGDFLVSAIFALILVFGSIKAFRTHYGGYLERPLLAERRFNAALFSAKAAILFGAITGGMLLSWHLISRTIANARPRLVGPGVDLLDVSVLSLHLSLLFAVSAIFILAIFVVRLALVWRGGRLFEGLAASAVAVAGFAFLNPGHWPLVCVAAALIALSMRIFPLIKKDETVSVIFASFFLVLICSFVVYTASRAGYSEQWKGYVRDKVGEYNKTEDNLILFTLPDICAEISTDPVMIRLVASRKESAAFEIWAESSLSILNYSCVVEIYDAQGARLSRFAGGMPFELPREQPDEARLAAGPFILQHRVETSSGAVLSCSGYSPVFNVRGEMLGWVEITVPYFFENPELLARQGRMAPEILQNIPSGERRSDRPDKELVIRVSGNRVISSSDHALRAGRVLPGRPGEWFTLRVGKETYNCAAGPAAGAEGYVVGYRVAGMLESLLQWAIVVSLDVLLTLVSLLALFVLKRLPVLREVMPDVSPVRGLGFRQKVLLSFLVVSILPVVILGIFSSKVIARRYHAEEENKALIQAQAAASLIDHSIRTEAASMAGGRYIAELLASEGRRDLPAEAGIDKRLFTLIGSDGEVLYGSAAAGLAKEELGGLLAGANIDRVAVSYDEPVLYGVVVVPIVSHGDRGGYLYYRRSLDDGFVKSVATALGLDINIYYRGLIRASSERELFVGGILDPICAPSVFVDIALEASRAAVLRETLGDFSYYVASAPLTALAGAESAVLSVPMLYQPTLMQEEMRRTSALILGLLALLFGTTVTLGVFLAGKIFNPIAALQGGTRRVIEGELEFRLEAEAPDEIGELVASFNAMTAALREARRDLLERQRYLSAVLDNIATGVMATDRDGKIITLNPSGERILNVTGSEFVGKAAEEALGGGLAPLGELFSTGGEDVRDVELTLVSKETTRTLKAVVASLMEGGERLGTVVVFDDLTELIRTKKLAAWVEMARQIAHEVKNPLTPIKLSAQLMKRAYESGNEEFGTIFRSGVETVIQQTEILRRIASEFSSFGKAMRLNPEPVPLGEFLAEVASYYRGSERIRIRLSAEEPLTVRADREALRKILVNLLENAIEATPGEGDISVASRREGDMARISVIDSGTGLSSEYQKRLFEPYFSTKTNGIGLGLAICQGLARAMDGDILLRNREGAHGVEATLSLPLAENR